MTTSWRLPCVASREPGPVRMIENRDACEQRNLSAASAGAIDLSHASHHLRCAGWFPVSFQSKLKAGKCWLSKAAIVSKVEGPFDNSTFG